MGAIARNLGATVEDARVLGAWIDRQAWLSPVMLDTVLIKWDNWLTRARAESAATEANDGPKSTLGGAA